MNVKVAGCLRRLLKEESGQILPWAVFLFAFLLGGLGALVVDVGRGVVAQRLLQASADAAAMAGAQSMGASIAPVQSTIVSQACKFGGQTGGGNCSTTGLNANSSLIPSAQMASGYPSVYCSTTLSSAGLPCSTITTTGGAVSGNTVKVVETEALPTWFGAMVGIPKLNLTAASMAAMRGSPRNPYNVALVIDTTASMNSTDGRTSNCSGTRVSCALEGALTLLGDLSPCSSGGSCGSVVSGTTNVKNPIDEVAVYTFHGVINTTDATGDASCGSPNAKRVTMQSPGKSGATIQYYTNSPVYQIVGFSSNYASTDPTSQSNAGANNTNLQSNALLVDATGGGSCAGLQAVGGVSTYFAEVINQAQSDLVAQQTLRASAGQQTQNVMIILSDGDAEAGASDMPNGNYSSTYPGLFNECQQAVSAASAATTAGTTVYTVAYGTQSSGCDTDQSNYSLSVTTGSGKNAKTTTYKNTNPSNLTPCGTMKAMASSTSTFYSDYVAGGNGGSNDNSCAGQSGTDTSLNDIFSFIASNLSEARLVPWGTT